MSSQKTNSEEFQGEVLLWVRKGSGGAELVEHRSDAGIRTVVELHLEYFSVIKNDAIFSNTDRPRESKLDREIDSLT